MISEHISVSDDILHQMKNFENGYPHSNALLQSRLKLKLCKSHKAAHHPTKFDRVPTSSGNHGKPGKSLKKVP